MESVCPKCTDKFNPSCNRIYDLSFLPEEKKKWPWTFYYGMKEFENYQIVRCPSCGNVFSEKQLKLFGHFSPLQAMILAGVLGLAFILYFYLAVVK